MTAKRRSVIVLVAGAAVLITCAVFASVQFAGVLYSAIPHRVPGRFQLTLSSGRWDVYQLTGTTSGTSVGGVSYTVTNQQAPTLDSSTISVTAPDGRRLPLRSRSGNISESLRRGSELYTGVVSFEAPVPGRYSVAVHGDGPGDVIVSKAVLSVLAGALPWIAGATAGGLCLLTGLILLIGAHRRRPLPPAAAAAPGSS